MNDYEKERLADIKIELEKLMTRTVVCPYAREILLRSARDIISAIQLYEEEE